MNKIKIFTWFPVVIGIGLLVVAKINMVTFDPQTDDVRTLLSRELPIIFIGLTVSILVFISSFYWLYKKQGRLALQAIVSPILFIVCISIGGAMGAAYLNAT